MLKHRAKKALTKKAKKGLTGYPAATFAFYGPTDRQASKLGLLKKAASRVLASFPCSRTGSTLCAQNWLRPCWTNFFEPPRGLYIQRACGPICPWELLLFNTPKLVVGILAHEDAGPDPMRKWFSDGDLRNEEEALQEALAFIREHKAKSVAIADRIIGCPHEEGPDYPKGEWCPQCPFWKGRDRWSGEREHEV